MEKSPSEPDGLSVLLIRFSSIGDIILTTPLIKKIRDKYQAARIDYLTLDRYGELLRDNPHIDNLHLIKSNMPIHGLIESARELSKHGYDYLFDLHRSTRSALFRLFIHSAKKYRMNKSYLKRILLVSFKINLYREPYSVVNRYFHAAGELDITPDADSEIWISRKELEEYLRKRESLFEINTGISHRDEVLRVVRGLLHSNRRDRIISMMPFATWQTKEWGSTRFIELGRRLSGENTLIMIHGGAEDSSRADSIAGAIGGNTISIAGKTTLLESALILSISECLITNDTGIMHIGGAVKIPVIAIFGSTTEELGFFPFRSEGEVLQAELNCRPCTSKGLRHCPRGHFRCMNDITVDEVFSAAEKFL
jgi:lipopolysaccharide heptosyltransferase II